MFDAQPDQPPGKVTVEVTLAEGAGPSALALRRALEMQLAVPTSVLRQSALFKDAETPTQGCPAGRTRCGRRPSGDDSGAAPSASLLECGQRVLYAAPDGRQRPTTIQKVHRDDGEPYFTILVDGKERSTERDRLVPISGSTTASEVNVPSLRLHGLDTEAAARGPPPDGASWVSFDGGGKGGSGLRRGGGGVLMSSGSSSSSSKVSGAGDASTAGEDGRRSPRPHRHTIVRHTSCRRSTTATTPSAENT